ncbi:hypothetical protein OAX78_02105 [Planctomycetota bacterium]|nr:hypothetical protein [Planctomycetota bacterium]
MVARSHAGSLLWGCAVAALVAAPATGQEEPDGVAPVDSSTPALDDDLTFRAWPFLSQDEVNGRTETAFMWPLYTSTRGEGYDEFHLRPFYDYVHDEALEQTSVDVLWPLFHYEQLQHQRWMRISPLYWSYANQHAGYDLMAPLWYRSWDQNQDRMIALPWVVYDRRDDRTDLHAWPLFGRHDLKGGGTRWFTLGHSAWWETGRDDGAGSYAVLPLGLYSQWDKDSEFFFSLTGLTAWSESPHSSWLAAFPFALLYENGEDSSGILTIPYSYQHDRVATTHHVLFPLASFAESHDGQRRAGAVRPLFWWESSPTESWSLGVPFYYWHQTERSTQLLSIPYSYHADEEGSRHDVLFPLVSWSENAAGTESSVAARPLFWHDNTKDLTRTLALPLFYYQRNKQTDASFFYGLPFFVHASEGDAETTVLPPFYWSHQSAEGSSLHVWPFYSHRVQPNYEEHGALWPLVAFGSGEDVEHSRALPLFLHHRTPELEVDSILPPLYFNVRQPGARVLEVALPLLYWFVGHEARQERLGGVFPLYWHYRDQGEALDVVAPLFGRYQSGSRDTWFATPLVWHSEDSEAQSSTTVAAPLYYRHRSPGVEHDVALGLYYALRHGTKRTNVAFPLWWDFEDEVAQTRTSLAFPLYWRHREPGHEQDVILGLYGSFRTGEHSSTMAFPVYWDFEDENDQTTVVFPFFGHNRSRDPNGQRADETTTSVLGLYWSVQRPNYDFQAVAPLYWDFDPAGPDRSVHLFPFFSYTTDGDYTEVGSLWPLFSYGAGTKRSRMDTLWPLGTHQRTQTGVHSRFLPLYRYEREQEDWSLDVLWPLLRWEGDAERAEFAALYGGLASYESDGEDHDLRVLGWLYRHQQQGASVDHYLPPLYRYARWNEGQEASFQFLWPLFFGGPEAPGIAEYMQLATFHETATSIEYRLFYRLFHFRSSQEGSVFEFNPLFSYEHEGENETYQVLGGVYNVVKRRGEWESVWLWGLF